MNEEEQIKLKARIDFLQIGYLVLFGGSLVMLAIQWTVPAMRGQGRIVWFVLLASAFGVRRYRTSLINRYNAGIDGRLQ